MEILVFIQSLDNKVNNNSLEALCAAQKISSNNNANIHAVTFSKNIANQLEYTQRPGVKERIKQQIVDRAVAKRIEKINKNELSICKKICLKYAVKKPTNNSRYGSGQKRFHTFDIFFVLNHI